MGIWHAFLALFDAGAATAEPATHDNAAFFGGFPDHVGQAINTVDAVVHVAHDVAHQAHADYHAANPSEGCFVSCPADCGSYASDGGGDANAHY